MTDFADALQSSVENKKNDINTFVWKHQNGKEERLMDMTSDDLQKCYDHVNSMLFNRNKFNPGKHEVRKNIKETYNSCNAELFMRYLINECDIDAIKSNRDLLDYIRHHRSEKSLSMNDSIDTIFDGLPIVYKNITIDKLLDACLDKLGILNRKMISNKFILSQGIWLTDEEKRELTEFDPNGKIRNRMEVIKERLVLNDISLRIDSNGLTYGEFRALVKLDSLPKISTIPTFTLKTLRDKILLLLDNDLNYHITKWEAIKSNVEQVAKYKNIHLLCREY